MLPNTCRVVVAEVELLPRRVRGLLPPSARQNLVPEVAAPKAEQGGSPCPKLSNGGFERKVSMSKRTRPIVKAREARKRRQVKELLPSDPPATFGADNPPGPLKPPMTRQAITCLVGVLHLTLAPPAYHDFEDICVGVYEQIRSHPPTEISAKT